MQKVLFILLLPYIVWADIQPQNVLAKSCLEYYNTHETQKEHKAFVYAREKETDKDRCNWSYGYATAQEAIDSAMKGCQSVVLNAECTLLYTDGVFKVKDGIFTSLAPVDNSVLTPKEKEVLIKKAKPLIRGNCLPFFTKNYLDAKGHKSFGYSIDANGNYACGYAYENQTEMLSQKQAIKSCEDNKVKRGDKAPKSPCKVYATAHNTLLKASNFDTIKPEETLEQALHKGKLEKVKLYIEKGSDVNTQTKKDGITALFLAAAKADKDFFFLLIKKGANIKHRAKDKSSVLHAATMGGNIEIVKHLLAKGLDVNAKGFEGNSPLHVSSMMMKDKISQILVEAGANQNIKNDKDKRAGAELRELEEKITSMVMDEINTTKSQKPQKNVDLHTPTSLKNAIDIAVKVMSKTLPMKIDDENQLTKVSAKGNIMILGFTLTNLSSTDISAEKLKSLLYDDIKKQVCTDDETITMLKKGMITEYTYEGKDKRHITTFSFDAKGCGLKTHANQLIENVKKLLEKK